MTIGDAVGDDAELHGAPQARVVSPRLSQLTDEAFDPSYEQVPPRKAVSLRVPLRDLLVHAFYNRRVILLTALLPVLAGIGLAVVYGGARFTADATLVVLVGRENTSSSDITGASPINLSITGLKEVASEIDIIYSNDVIDQTIRTIGPAVLLPSIGQGRLFGLLPAPAPSDQVKALEDWFRSRLRAAVQNDTNVLHVTFIHPDRALAIRTLSVLIDAYFSHRRQVYANVTSSYLSTELTGYTSRLGALEAQIQAVKAEYGVLDIAKDITTASERIDRIQRVKDELTERREAARAQATAGAAKLAAEPRSVFASRDLTNQHANDDSRNALLRLRVERDHLAVQYESNYPPLVELDRKIASTQAAIANAQRTNSTATRDVRNPTWDTLNDKVLAAQIEQAALDQQLQQVESELVPAKARAAALLTAEAKLRELNRSRDVLEASYRQFASREASARIDEDAARERNANVHVVQQPTAPYRGASLRLSFLAAGLLGGVLLAGAAAVLSTMLRNVYILPSEAERHLRIPVVADVPVGPRQIGTPAGARPIANLAVMLLDISTAAERFGVFQFVSTEQDAVAGSLVRALATEFAVIHNLKTLLIDMQGDGRDHLAALGRGVGLSRNAADANLSIQPTATPTLFVALDGANSDLANTRTVLPQARRMLRSLRTSYDMVLTVAPPVTDDYAARRLATLVDANLIVLQADRTSAGTAAALCESLLAAGAAIFGTVLTGPRTYVPRFILRWL
jgi:uncharacterized protein involved in exopolysaccharide biosynthesis